MQTLIQASNKNHRIRIVEFKITQIPQIHHNLERKLKIMSIVNTKRIAYLIQS